MTQLHNGSEFTLTLVNAPKRRRGDVKLIEANALAAVKYLGDHIRWQGVLDFVVYWDNENILGNYWKSNGPGFGAYGDAYDLAALEEATTGIDPNGSDFDVGTWLRPGSLPISDYGEDIYIDPEPNPLDDDITSTDFLSIFLHETLHSLGMWSVMQHGSNLNPTKFDSLTKKIDDQWFFVGNKTQEIYGAPLPLALTGSRDHYSDSLELDIDLMREYALSEKWQISDIDLAILSDLGHEVIKWSFDPESTPEPTTVAPAVTSTQDVVSNVLTLPSQFKKKSADKITNFNPTSDTLEIDIDSFGIDSSATFASGKNKKVVKKKLANKDFDFLYDEKKGGLYFNENGVDKGFGDGGIISILKGAPDLTMDNIDFI